MGLVLEFLVLAFTAVVWWLARRDLSTRASQVQAPAIEEWERLRVAVEALIADLERRAVVAEQRVTGAEQRVTDAEMRVTSAEMRVTAAEQRLLFSEQTAQRPGPRSAQPAERPLDSAPLPISPAVEAAHEARYAPVYSLISGGETDAAAIAHRTGLGLGEVELILGLHARPKHS